MLSEIVNPFHKIPTLNDPKKEDFWKYFGKRRKCWKPAFSPFLKMFSTILKTNFNFSVTFILLSASALLLDHFKIVSFGEELISTVLNQLYMYSFSNLTHYQTTKF